MTPAEAVCLSVVVSLAITGLFVYQLARWIDEVCEEVQSLRKRVKTLESQLSKEPV